MGDIVRQHVYLTPLTPGMFPVWITYYSFNGDFIGYEARRWTGNEWGWYFRYQNSRGGSFEEMPAVPRPELVIEVGELL